MLEVLKEWDKETLDSLSDHISGCLDSTFGYKDEISDTLTGNLILVWFVYNVAVTLKRKDSDGHMPGLLDWFIQDEEVEVDGTFYETEARVVIPGLCDEFIFESYSSAYGSLEEFYIDLVDFKPKLLFTSRLMNHLGIYKWLEDSISFAVVPMNKSPLLKWYIY